MKDNMIPEINEIKHAHEIGKKGKYLHYIWSPCTSCSKPRWVICYKGIPIRGTCRSCACKIRPPISDESRKRMSVAATGRIGLKGDKAPTWKGGRTRREGYVLIKLYPDDFFYPMATKDSHYVLEHRLVIAQNIGRCLNGWEIVHHKNGIRNDNRLENLELTMNQYHNTHTVEDALKKYIVSLEEKVKLLENLNAQLLFLCQQ